MRIPTPKGLLATKQPDLFFEDNAVGRMKKEIWDASDAQIDAILAEYGIPPPLEWAKPGSYIQTTVRHQVEQPAQERRGLHPGGLHREPRPAHVSASDTLYVTHDLRGRPPLHGQARRARSASPSRP